MRKVFLSHAQADRDLVDRFQCLLEQGVGVAPDEIFCTSLEGLGIPAGVPDFKEYIRQEINGSELVVALISSNYYASPFCMCELGAAWVLAKNFFPILVHPVDFQDLRGTLSGMQCSKLADPSSVTALYDRLHSVVAKPSSVARWETRKALFYKDLPAVLASIKPTEIISYEKYVEAQKKSDEAVSLNMELQEELDQKEKELIETRKAKSAKDVAVIRQKFSTEMEQYGDLIDECRAALSKLPWIVREALYYEVRNEQFILGGDDFGDARAAQDEELLHGGLVGDPLVPNGDRPPVRRAQVALKHLTQFLEGASHDFFEDATRNLGDTPDLRRRSYWRTMDFF